MKCVCLADNRAGVGWPCTLAALVMPESWPVTALCLLAWLPGARNMVHNHTHKHINRVHSHNHKHSNQDNRNDPATIEIAQEEVIAHCHWEDSAKKKGKVELVCPKTCELWIEDHHLKLEKKFKDKNVRWTDFSLV